MITPNDGGACVPAELSDTNDANRTESVHNNGSATPAPPDSPTSAPPGPDNNDEEQDVLPDQPQPQDLPEPIPVGTGGFGGFGGSGVSGGHTLQSTTRILTPAKPTPDAGTTTK